MLKKTLTTLALITCVGLTNAALAEPGNVNTEMCTLTVVNATADQVVSFNAENQYDGSTYGAPLVHSFDSKELQVPCSADYQIGATAAKLPAHRTNKETLLGAHMLKHGFALGAYPSSFVVTYPDMFDITQTR